MAYLNDVLFAYLAEVTGLVGLTSNDMLARLDDINYVIPPRNMEDPVNPPLGAMWTDLRSGEIRQMVAGGIRKVADAPPTP